MGEVGPLGKDCDDTDIMRPGRHGDVAVEQTLGHRAQRRARPSECHQVCGRYRL